MTKNNIFAIKFWSIFILIYAIITKYTFNNFGKEMAVYTILGIGAIIFILLIFLTLLRIIMLFLDKNQNTKGSKFLIRVEESFEILTFRK